MPLTVRLGLFYGAVFIGSGVSSPYLPVWFAHHGMSGSRIGLILSLPMLARAITAPLLAVWADSFRLRRTALLILALAVTVTYAAMALPWGSPGRRWCGSQPRRCSPPFRRSPT
jgi:PPP family 3-phenylpropionic acid transporter